ncbi:hypothetical protein GF351_01705 [Candidatus Woesearchaeota archaeon]|nr:hypothetical protein [Candidatus Woesearchaeota archaeon]
MADKKKLTHQQEFEIMKLILDKFLWLGFAVMAFGLYNMWAAPSILTGIAWLVVGAVILVLFMIIIVKEYEFVVK